MNINDILEVAFLSAVLFFLLGYGLRPKLDRWFNYLGHRLLPPRYLKSEGTLLSRKLTSKIKKK